MDELGPGNINPRRPAPTPPLKLHSRVTSTIWSIVIYPNGRAGTWIHKSKKPTPTPPLKLHSRSPWLCPQILHAIYLTLRPSVWNSTAASLILHRLLYCYHCHPCCFSSGLFGRVWVEESGQFVPGMWGEQFDLWCQVSFLLIIKLFGAGEVITP